MIHYLFRFVRPLLPEIIVFGTIAAAFILVASHAHGHDLLLASGNAWPGTIQLRVAGSPPREVFRRTLVQPGDVVPKLTAVTMSPRGEAFFASGLDGHIFRAAAGNETLVHSHHGQVRDLAFGSDPNSLYYSVVATPQNGEPLPDGEIHRLNLTTGQTTRMVTVAQAEVGRAWWGAFTIHAGRLHIGTLTQPSRVLRLGDARWETIFETNTPTIHGLAFTDSGDLFLVGSGPDVYVSHDLIRLDVVLESAGQSFADVAIATAPADTLSPRPAAPGHPAPLRPAVPRF